MTHERETSRPNVRRTLRQVQLCLRFLCAAGLIIDAVVHLLIAGDYDRIGSALTEGTLFRIESVAALLAAFAVLATSHRAVAAFAALVAVTAFAAVIVSVNWQLGAIGPFPDMYEPIWYGEKSLAAFSEGVATVAAVVLLIRPIAHAARRTGTGANDARPARSR